MSRVLRVSSGFFALLFAFGAAVQWNDPDPLRWILAYGSVAVLCVGAAFGRLSLAPTAAVFAAGVVWLVLWSPAFPHSSLDAARSFGMSGAPEEEEVREAWGLALLVAWTAVLLFQAWRSRGEPARPEAPDPR